MFPIPKQNHSQLITRTSLTTTQQLVSLYIFFSGENSSRAERRAVECGPAAVLHNLGPPSKSQP